jgi:hypothetical protein
MQFWDYVRRGVCEHLGKHGSSKLTEGVEMVAGSSSAVAGRFRCLSTYGRHEVRLRESDRVCASSSTTLDSSEGE